LTPQTLLLVGYLVQDFLWQELLPIDMIGRFPTIVTAEQPEPAAIHRLPCETPLQDPSPLPTQFHILAHAIDSFLVNYLNM
jgi:hypothetical protein